MLFVKSILIGSSRKGVAEMVIQSNMSPESIVDVWGDTAVAFKKFNIPITKQSLETLVQKEILPKLLKELNDIVGSSTATCIEGG